MYILLLSGQPFSILLTEFVFTFTGVSYFSDFNYCYPDYCDGKNSNIQSTSVSILTLATKWMFDHI